MTVILDTRLTPGHVQRRPCSCCGEPKPPGRGRSLCDTCRPARYASNGHRVGPHVRQPCRGCGGAKEPGRIFYCATCAASARIRLCRCCNEHKPPDAFDRPQARKCLECWAREPERICRGCQETLPMSRYASGRSRYCLDCHKPARQPCLRCGGEKDRTKGVYYCAACRKVRAAEREAYRLCRGCGAEKPPGAGRRLCDACIEAERWRCHKCGDRGPRSMPQRRWCDPCAELMRWQHQRKRKAYQTVKRKPCRGCGGAKEGGRRHTRYCEACLRRRARPRTCPRCGEHPVTTPRAKTCDICRAGQMRRRTERRLERLAADPNLREREREYSRRAYINRKRRGRRLRPAPGPKRQPCLLAAPLARHLDRLIAAERIGNPWGFDDGPDNRAAACAIMCERAGISERRLLSWRKGEAVGVQFDLADAVLQRLDLLWFDVWNSETVRLPLLEVRSYRSRQRRSRGKLRIARERVGAVRYGDRGPDIEALRIAAEAFGGDLSAALFDELQAVAA